MPRYPLCSNKSMTFFPYQKTSIFHSSPQNAYDSWWQSDPVSWAGPKGLTTCWHSIESWLLHRDPYVGVSKNRGTPKWMVKIMEIPIKMDDLGKPTIFGTPIWWIIVYCNAKYINWGGIIPYIQQIKLGFDMFWSMLMYELSSTAVALSSARHDLGLGKLWTTQMTHALLF